MALLRAAGEGRVDPAELVRHGSWEKPVDLAAAIALGRPASFAALNLPNRGQIPELPAGAIVETPCVGAVEGPVPQTVHLPMVTAELCCAAAQVSGLLVRAWRDRSAIALREALEADPTILPDERPGARAALRACLLAHADILPSFPHAL